jgi:hypothetical protein
MHPQFWEYRCTKIDLEDLDVSVQLTHRKSLESVTVKFRVDGSAPDTSGKEIWRRVEHIARNHLLNLAAALEAKGWAAEPVRP